MALISRLVGHDRIGVSVTPDVVRESIRRRQDDQERRVAERIRADAIAADRRIRTMQ